MNDQNFNEAPMAQSIPGKIISTGFKVEGWDYRGRVLRNIFFGIVMILLGVYVAYEGNLKTCGVLFLFGILFFLGAWYYWWRSKSLVKGKFYVPSDKQN